MTQGETGRDQGAQDSVDEVLGRVDPREVVRSIASFARENPHVALAAAAGLGFLLGGGLTPRALGKIGLIATRGYLRGTVTQALQAALDAQLRPDSEAA